MSDDEREDVGNGGDDVQAVNAVRNAEEAVEEKVEVEAAKMAVEALHLQSLDLL